MISFDDANQYEDYTSDPVLGEMDAGAYQTYQYQPDVVLKLRGLPWTCTVNEILDFFGDDVSCVPNGIHLITTSEGRASGEAFVEVNTEDDIKIGLSKNKNSIGHRYIEVFKVKRSEMDWILRKASRQGAGLYDEDEDVSYATASAGSDYGYGTVDNGSRSMLSSVSETPVVYEHLTTGEADLAECDTFVRLRGLPFECGKNDILQFFSGLEIAPNGVHMGDDGSGRNTGEAYVQFTSKEEAGKALEYDRQCIGHRYIEVFRVGNNEMKSIDMTVGRRSRQQVLSRSLYERPRPYERPRADGARTARYGTASATQRYYTKKERYEDWYTYANEVDTGTSGSSRSATSSSSVNSLAPPPPPPLPLIPGLKRPAGPASLMGAGSNYGGDNSKYWLMMRGLPFKATEDDILEFFEPLTPSSIHIIFDASGRPSGTAKVIFPSQEDLNASMGKHRNLMQHRYIELFPGGF